MRVPPTPHKPSARQDMRACPQGQTAPAMPCRTVPSYVLRTVSGRPSRAMRYAFRNDKRAHPRRTGLELSVGFLDDLKRQADARKTQQTLDTDALARNAALTEAACKTALAYFMELAPQLNVLQITPRVRYSLDSRTPLEGLVRGGFVVDARRKSHRGQEVYDHVVVHGRQTTGQTVVMTKDFPPEIERLEARLRQAGITPDTEVRRDPVNGRLLNVQFRFVADVVASVKLLPDHDAGRVRFHVLNLDALETVDADFPATAVGSGLLDDLARWLTGEPNRFLQQAEQVKRVEA